MNIDTPEVEFDTHGVPTGEAGEAMWLTIAQGLLGTMEQEQGWDAGTPHTLFAVLTPAMSEAVDPDGVRELRVRAGGPDGGGTAYGIVPLLTYGDTGRVSLAGLTAPAGTAALVSVTEAWMARSVWLDANDGLDIADLLEHPEKATRAYEPVAGMPMTREEQARVAASRGQVDDAHRPSRSPDRIEVRQALVVRPDGTVRAYLHRRGMQVDEPGGCLVIGAPGSKLSVDGVIVDLLRRAFGLDVTPDVTVGEILGRGVLGCLGNITAAINGGVENSPSGTMRQTAELVIAAVLDTLETPCPADIEPGTVPALIGASGTTVEQMPGWQAAGATGPLYLAARRVSKTTWEGFLALPGAHRWVAGVREEEPFDPALWDWYGPGHLSRFADETLPDWGDSVERLTELVGRARSREVLDVLAATGWIFSQAQSGLRDAC